MEDNPVRIMSLNLHKGLSMWNSKFVLPAMRTAIQGVSADVVFLQEVIGEHQGLAGRFSDWPQTGQYEYLADTIWPDFAYGRNAVAEGRHHGNAVLSKYPIVAWKNHDISFKKGESRGVLHCQLQPFAGRKTMHVCCVHLGLTSRERRYQLCELCHYIQVSVPMEAPLLIAGDFNDWHGYACKYMKDELGVFEAFTEHSGKPARSFPVKMPVLRLDRVYYRNLAANSAQVLRGLPWSRLSDHAPLKVDVEPCE